MADYWRVEVNFRKESSLSLSLSLSAPFFPLPCHSTSVGRLLFLSLSLASPLWLERFGYKLVYVCTLNLRLVSAFSILKREGEKNKVAKKEEAESGRNLTNWPALHFILHSSPFSHLASVVVSSNTRKVLFVSVRERKYSFLLPRHHHLLPGLLFFFPSACPHFHLPCLLPYSLWLLLLALSFSLALCDFIKLNLDTSHQFQFQMRPGARWRNREREKEFLLSLQCDSDCCIRTSAKGCGKRNKKGPLDE